MGLFADPARLDGPGQLFERRVGGQVGQIVFALTGRTMFANNPDILAGQMLASIVMNALWRAIGDADANANANSGKAS